MEKKDHKPSDVPQEMTEALLSQIDNVLMRNVKVRWAKAALIIANAMTSAELIDLGFSDEVYAERLKELMKAGQIQVQGSLDRIRFCEVRKLEV